MEAFRKNEGEWLRTAAFFGGLMCLLALLPLPMQSFYPVFRLVTTLAAGWLATYAYRRQKLLQALTFAAIAIFFNPFWQIEVPALVWRPAALVAAVLLFMAAPRQNAASSPSSSSTAAE